MEKKNLVCSPVVFDNEHHTYTLDGHSLSGVTPIIAWLFPDTYKGTPYQYKRRCTAHRLQGTPSNVSSIPTARTATYGHLRNPYTHHQARCPLNRITQS